MPEGFQVVGDRGTLQVDSDFINLALVRSGRVFTDDYSNGGNKISKPSRVVVTLYPDEIIAISSEKQSAIVGRDGNTVTIASPEAKGQPVDYWVFGPGITRSNSGIQVFRKDGVVCFDSGWKLMNVQGVASGFGVTSFPSGQRYAVVPLNMYFRSENYGQAQGVQPAVFYIWVQNSYMSSAAVSNGQITISSSVFETNAYQQNYGSNTPIGFTDDRNNGVVPTYLVVDVTGL